MEMLFVFFEIQVEFMFIYSDEICPQKTETFKTRAHLHLGMMLNFEKISEPVRASEFHL